MILEFEMEVRGLKNFGNLGECDEMCEECWYWNRWEEFDGVYLKIIGRGIFLLDWVVVFWRILISFYEKVDFYIGFNDCWFGVDFYRILYL